MKLPNFLTSKIFLKIDDTMPSGFSVDAKWVGNALDDVFKCMDDRGIKIIPELQELKQYLRFKGNSKREEGDLKYWRDE